VLDTAFKNNGYIPKEEYYGSSFEQPGMSYQDWILQLKRAGILAQYKDEDQPSEKADWIRFKPGPLTLPYVNKEKLHREEVASMRDVYDLEERLNSRKADRSELEDLKARMNEIAEAVRDLQEASIPPDTLEKKQTREKAMAKIALRSVG
jgi:hypothetical protein